MSSRKRILNRQDRRAMKAAVEKQPAVLTRVPECDWPLSVGSLRIRPYEVWVSRKFCVQFFAEDDDIIRLSVNRTEMRSDSRWADGLTWDDLQSIKRQVGLGHRFAVEIYPEDRNIINVANMRHLWVLPQRLSLGWTGIPS